MVQIVDGSPAFQIKCHETAVVDFTGQPETPSHTQLWVPPISQSCPPSGPRAGRSCGSHGFSPVSSHPQAHPMRKKPQAWPDRTPACPSAWTWPAQPWCSDQSCCSCEALAAAERSLELLPETSATGPPGSCLGVGLAERWKPGGCSVASERPQVPGGDHRPQRAPCAPHYPTPPQGSSPRRQGRRLQMGPPKRREEHSCADPL